MSFNKVPNVPGSPALSALLKVSVIGGLGLYAITNSLYNVEGGHRAVMFNRLTGIKEKVYPEGTHFMLPWFERPIIYDVRARPYLVESTTGSHDLQMKDTRVKLGDKPDDATGRTTIMNVAGARCRPTSPERKVSRQSQKASHIVL
ncbi:hypothetical protein F2Q70_00037947 [Brassica cretica]|uniref:Prohibitin n=1 Tax=Brassica cretica TaxID=69181 RepID=A0A8S9K9H9_BRACR|nr:hypothetical protein F2Q70_00037947 [Brassica cretica]